MHMESESSVLDKTFYGSWREDILRCNNISDA